VKTSLPAPPLPNLITHTTETEPYTGHLCVSY